MDTAFNSSCDVWYNFPFLKIQEEIRSNGYEHPIPNIELYSFYLKFSFILTILVLQKKVMAILKKMKLNN